jgi:hypothetical protein
MELIGMYRLPLVGERQAYCKTPAATAQVEDSQPKLISFLIRSQP